MTAKEIKSLRLRLNLTQAELAEICGVTRDSVGKWETGKRPPNGAAQATLDKLATGELTVNPPRWTIRNDFHNTVAPVRRPNLTRIEVRTIRKQLCGVEGCQCSGELGERGRPAIVDQDGRAWWADMRGDGGCVLRKESSRKAER